jgi:hypothetical protein
MCAMLCTARAQLARSGFCGDKKIVKNSQRNTLTIGCIMQTKSQSTEISASAKTGSTQHLVFARHLLHFDKEGSDARCDGRFFLCLDSEKKIPIFACSFAQKKVL